MRAILIDRLGGPEQLRITDQPDPRPGPGEIRVAVAVAGVNFMDTGTRRMGPPDGRIPVVPGVEGAGRVVELGEGATGLSVGDRVAWTYVYGSYAEQLVMPVDHAVPVPDDISDEAAASIMLQGLTAHHFVTEAAPVSPGQLTLVHAAAGGVGQKLVQLIKARGGRVIGLVSGESKADIARRAGADDVVVSTGPAFVEPVMELSGGEGVHTVFDGGGETTFRASTSVVRRNGTLLYFGPLIGSVPTLNLRDLPNSIKVGYPVFHDHIPTRQALLRHTADLFDMVRDGRLTTGIGGRYPLADAEQAHRDIESRTTTGKLVLLP
ncbi:quinone oxidoreductase family protein [Kibdelosporangium phytohabitans]|uniref:Alcohol dehydrogenase n=1 Tax=Kibdelosporangium phytohabitans TaxID=860235 RepID=A0A0N7F3L1_9PSEU|nr:quinone oxidoreductase [Kibdelosporangium phytohabitans]ALG08935.1 alcohol dehydrogenase [Kibdelosporangium phytohabitans]MBE1469903.1 NADPH:quinone reductase-like Zn-dependent oxidoreductase [Kibdelosporangium phytohabitans]